MTNTATLVDLPQQQVPQKVTEVLGDFFETRRTLVTSIDGVFSEVVDSLEAFILDGGKRVRPSFAWQGWLGAGGADGKYADAEDPAAVFSALCALELIQGCALIHDDIIDQSDTRRGNPTIHRIWAKRHRYSNWHGNPDHYGTSTAILAGDVSLVWADDMLLNAGLSPAAIARLLPAWQAMRTEVLGGQLLDITSEASSDPTLETAKKINLYKTAAYTIERPLHLGAAIAGAPEELISAYRSFGRDIGIAFQLRDDLLGVFGDPAVTGKPAGDDLREGKRTVLIANALAILNEKAPDKAAFVSTKLGEVHTPEEISELRDVIDESGAADAVESQIDMLTERAFSTLEATDLPAENRATLVSMGMAATARRA